MLKFYSLLVLPSKLSEIYKTNRAKDRFLDAAKRFLQIHHESSNRNSRHLILKADDRTVCIHSPKIKVLIPYSRNDAVDEIV